MKASKTKLAILIVFIIFLAVVLGSCAVLNVEKQKYSVVEKDGAFEVRTYEPYVVIETLVDSDFEEAGNTAFGRLFSYIDGNNRAKEKIAMTAPVSQQLEQDDKGQKIAMTAPVSQEKSGDNWAVSFIMPAKYTMETLPEPSDNRVLLKAKPGGKMASIRYRGSWSRKLYEEKEIALLQFIEEQGLEIIGQPIWARYNPPFYPSFLRRNEILFPVE